MTSSGVRMRSAWVTGWRARRESRLERRDCTLIRTVRHARRGGGVSWPTGQSRGLGDAVGFVVGGRGCRPMARSPVSLVRPEGSARWSLVAGENVGGCLVVVGRLLGGIRVLGQAVLDVLEGLEELGLVSDEVPVVGGEAVEDLSALR